MHALYSSAHRKKGMSWKIHLPNDAFVLVRVISLQKQIAGRALINRSNLLPVKAKTALPNHHIWPHRDSTISRLLMDVGIINHTVGVNWSAKYGA